MEPMKPMEPMRPMDFGPQWWPDNLGQPKTSGGQNEINYAFFPDKHRLAVQKSGQVTVYDSEDHQISDVQQRQSESSSLVFTSQKGNVKIDELKKVA